MEFMDGSAPICGTVNTLLTHNSTGRSVVWGAGNDGDADFHAAGTVSASGTLDLEERRFWVLYSGTRIGNAGICIG